MSKSLIDTDFDVDDDIFSPAPVEKEVPQKEVVQELPAAEEIEVAVVDDTPDEDRGKWTADKVPTEGAEEEDEATKYSRKVKERIGRETAKTHAERRAKEDRERQLAEATDFARRLIQENNQLKGMIESGEKVLITEHQGRLEGQLASAKAAYREAHEAGDVNGIVAAQENLAKLAAQLDRLTTHRANPLPRMEEREVERFVAPRQVQQAQPDPKAVEWQKANTWFGRDEGMTAYAMALHNRLVNQEGVLPDQADYYNRINTEMRTRFPERFTRERETAPRRTETVVAPASRTGSGKITRKVTLTETQVKLARRLGLTAQQYAEQIVAESGGSQEWTHGKS